MEYHEAVNFLFDLRRFKVKPGTESVRSLLAELGDPHEGVEYVQVAGSNGKGSSARMVESALRETDRRVGLYISPHFEDVRERVRVDGRKIPEESLREFVTEVKPILTDRAAAGEPITLFEALTAMALWYFGEADVDVAVLEVGMGGELDATSVVDPVASAVTNVSLEHTDVLGETIEEIAATKAKVAPADAPLVTAASGDALATVREVAGDVVTVGEAAGGEGDQDAGGEDVDGAEGGARDAGPDGEGTPGAADPDVAVRYEGRVNHAEAGVVVDGGDWRVDARIPLLGEYQALNAGIAVALVRQVAPELSPETIARGLRGAHWPGRFEVMERDPLVVLDGAHNPGACETLAATLAEFEYDDLHLVFGAMHDKDHRGMVAALPTPDSVTTCRPDTSRAEDPETLARVFERAGVDAVSERDSVATALADVRAGAAPDDCVLVMGSLSTVSEARTTWTRTVVPARVRDEGDAAALLDRAHVAESGPRSAASAPPESMVHRVVHTRVEERQARALTAELRSLGGRAAVSGQAVESELVDVVLAGTLAQFERLVDALGDAPHGLPGLAAQIARQVGLDESTVADGPADDAAPADRDYPWTDGAAVMGILNVTPDSFHDGGEFAAREDAVAQARELIDAGVDILDVGGESTRPGADEVPVADEIDRVVPVIEAVADLDVAISIDTRKAAVAEAALDAGADILNDVTGLEDPEMRFLAAERDVPVIVMHSIDAPVVPDRDVDYDDVVEDVIDELRERVLLAEKAGLDREQILVDPGLGFGKRKRESFELLGRLSEFRALGCPILVGHSHKSMFDLVGCGPGERGAATVAATALAVDRGADVIRVHDAAENVDAVRVAKAAADPSGFDAPE